MADAAAPNPTTLDGPRWGPASGGAPTSLVVLLHGWGADGDDLIGLAPHWGARLPDTLFVSPHGPEPCEMNPIGRQWFSLGDLTPTGGLSEAALQPRAEAVRPMVDAFIDDRLARLGLADDRLAVVGFSQGTMVALHVAIRRRAAPAALVGYSGRLIGAADLARDAVAKPPILLVHGAADDVVPAASTEAAARDLTAAGFAVEAYIRPGLGHGIDPEGLALGGDFLAARLGG
jgi:phospholipase/carboxylesterase